MSTKGVNKIIQDYLSQEDYYEEYAELIASLLKSFLLSVKIPFYTIDHRHKSIDSLRAKILRKHIQGKEYRNLQDITDLAGIRVVLFFSDDVQRVKDIVNNEFKCRVTDSKKRSNRSRSKIGYQAEHEVVKLSPKREKLNEYKRFKDLLCEVQIKSIMQHAWAEIEHDIGYKPKVKERDLIRSEIRDLFRENAKLIREVDKNFVIIREKHVALLAEYANKVEKHKLKTLPINYDTVRAYLRKELDQIRISRDIVLSTIETAQLKKCHNLLELNEHLHKESTKTDGDKNL